MDSQGELSTGEAFQGDDFTSNLVPLIHKYFESEGKAEGRGGVCIIICQRGTPSITNQVSELSGLDEQIPGSS